MRLPSLRATHGWLDVTIDGSPVRWGYRRITPRERIEVRATLRDWRAWQARAAVLSLEHAQALESGDVQRLGHAHERLLSLAHDPAHLDALIATLRDWTTEIRGVELGSGEVFSWRDADDATRAQLLDCLELHTASAMVDAIMDRSGLSELELGKSAPGSPPVTSQTGATQES